MIRPLLLSTSDKAGGAARSSWRLHRGLRAVGCPSRMLAFNKSSDDPAVRAFRPSLSVGRRLARRLRERSLRRDLPIRLAGDPPFEVFHTDRSVHGADLLDTIFPQAGGAPSVGNAQSEGSPDAPPDVLNLHWVVGMFDDAAFLPAAAARVPLVWTLHDMQPFTGGCHYDRGCGRFVSPEGRPGCGRCPQLAGDAERDLSRRIWERRARAFAKIPTDRLTFVTPSRWLGAEVGRSSLCGRFPVEVIPYGLETDVFRPRNQAAARELLGVPPDAKTALFLADAVNNVRKGFSYLKGALERLRGLPNLCALTVGRGVPDLPEGLPHVSLGSVSDDRLLALAYSAADLFVIPSLADNLPNTVLEAMACGTPSVGFAVGGVPDMIRPGETGLLAPPEDVPALADTLAALLSDDALRTRLGANCRRVAEAEYPLARQAHDYQALFARVAGAAA
ncbi:glycosyltransferase [Alienimonas californiensis]|uniref:Teichuronic acid biosynthesis glycosyltransferase TuaC n=1 Tax=Alienimonas californiensis TaxID=2527989 RepID=A0A517P848_9PLAN|nr:glycosyltransferase [Alienimonas californiensis]QDT15544.1 Putative teichuronic acid biosynthesis glycosyltransferase TuaC [Alienimonas californiensis]